MEVACFKETEITETPQAGFFLGRSPLAGEYTEEKGMGGVSYLGLRRRNEKFFREKGAMARGPKPFHAHGGSEPR